MDWDAPPNTSPDDAVYTVEVAVLDSVGQSDIEPAGDITVAGTPPFDEAPDVFDPTLEPSSLPSAGGPVDISASATDDRAISEVYATITSADGTEVVPLDGISASRYAATWDAPPNPAAADATYTVEITALDDIGQSDTVSAGDITVAGKPVTVSRLALSTRQLTFGPVKAGRTVRRAVVLSNVGTESIACTLSSPSRRFRLPGGRPLA